MKRYLITPAAEDDIREIAEYIARHSPQNAEKVVNRLYDTFGKIAELPQIGHIREELRDDTIRVTTLYKYLIIYDPTTPIVILRIIHGSRNLHWVRPRSP